MWRPMKKYSGLILHVAPDEESFLILDPISDQGWVRRLKDNGQKNFGSISINVCNTPTIFDKSVSYPNKSPKICVLPQPNPPRPVGRFIYDRSLTYTTGPLL